MKSAKHSAFNELVNIFELHMDRTVEAARELHWLLVAVASDTAACERRIHELQRGAEAITDLATTALERHHGPSALQAQAQVLLQHMGTLLACIGRAGGHVGTMGTPPSLVFELTKTLLRASEELQPLVSSLHDPQRGNERSFGCARVRGLAQALGTDASELPEAHREVVMALMQALSECESIATLLEKESLSPRSHPPRTHA
jgi:hypothetical protein